MNFSTSLYIILIFAVDLCIFNYPSPVHIEMTHALPLGADILYV